MRASYPQPMPKARNKAPTKPSIRVFSTAWSKTTKSSHYTPEDCARVVVRAIEDEPPRARYPVTREAKLGILAPPILADRVMDRQLRKTMGIPDYRARLQKATPK